jgi:DNA-binding response OmpR family regulator
VADLQLDVSSGLVRRGTRSIGLTERESSLMLLLFKQRGQVVSREQILREVWNDEQGVSSNVVEVYIRYLRQKLEEGGDTRLIHTIRGRGYCLNHGVPFLKSS